MLLITRALHYIANRYLADPVRRNQTTARINAAEASEGLRAKRRERTDIDTYVNAQLKARLSGDETGLDRDRGGVENAT